MRWKTPVIVVVLTTIGLVGGATFYVRGQVTRTLEEAITAIAPLAEVHYDNISVTLGGKIHVFDIDIRPRLANENLRVESLDIETPGLWFLLTGTRKLSDGKLPEHLRVTLNGFTVVNGGAVTESLDRVIALSAQKSGQTLMSNCGDLDYLDFKAYRRLGYQNLVFDIVAGYRFEPRGPLRAQLQWRTRDLATATIDFEFGAALPTFNDLMTSPPSLRTFTLTYQDLSITERLKKFCTEASGASVEQYIDSEVNRSDGAYQAAWGFVPGPGIRDAYRAFLVKPGEIRVQATPPAGVELQALRMFKPDDVVSMLNLRVSVNDTAVSDLSMTVANKPAEAAPAPTAKTAAKAGPSPALPHKPTPSEIIQRAQKRDPYRVVAVKDIGQHVNEKVRLTLARGTVREGLLVQVTNGTVRVERQYRSGQMVIAIPTKQIVQAEVLR